MNILADHIEQQLLRARIGKCAVDEEELQRLWPINMDNRQAAIEQFAEQYGFRLVYYSGGLCAIFEKKSRPVADKINAASFRQIFFGFDFFATPKDKQAGR